jgi:hypothetical protein
MVYWLLLNFISENNYKNKDFYILSLFKIIISRFKNYYVVMNELPFNSERVCSFTVIY